MSAGTFSQAIAHYSVMEEIFSMGVTACNPERSKRNDLSRIQTLVDIINTSHIKTEAGKPPLKTTKLRGYELEWARNHSSETGTATPQLAKVLQTQKKNRIREAENLIPLNTTATVSTASSAASPSFSLSANGRKRRQGDRWDARGGIQSRVRGRAGYVTI